ncbi:MAG: hypothetical protein GY774_17075 [Planctomycetes bacterium]|nr:hypothetical protein [Planctomycetota bacterium]
MEKQHKHPGGRPSKYTEDMPARVRYYVRNCSNGLPSQAGFALSVGVSERTIVRWKHKNEEFCQALEYLHTVQENELIQKGLTGEYNPMICKLILCSNHGYKKRTDVTTKDHEITPQMIDYADVVKNSREGTERLKS